MGTCCASPTPVCPYRRAWSGSTWPWAPGLPAFLPVLEAVLGELLVEKAVVAEEILTDSPAMHREITRRLGTVPIQTVPHEQFKKLVGGCRAVVRTGEFTHYSNVILTAGVVF